MLKMSRPTLKDRPVTFPARSREALDKAASDRISNRNRHDGYRAGGLASSYSRCRGLGDDNVYLLLYQLRREAKQSVEVAVCIAKFDGNVSALDVDEVFKALAKGLTVLGGRFEA